MTLENLITDLNDDSLDLEFKINSLKNYYYKFYNHDSALSIAKSHDNHQIDLLSLAKKIINHKSPKQLKNIKTFENMFFDIIAKADDINFDVLCEITFNFDEIFDKDSIRFDHLKTIAQKNIDNSVFLFKLITNNLEKYYEHLYLAVACLTIFEPNETKNYILNHFNIKEKNIDHLLSAIGCINYEEPSDATSILCKILKLIEHENLNGKQFSKIIEIITNMYVQHNTLENDIINALEAVNNNANLSDISNQVASLLFFKRGSLSKRIKEVFYKVILNADQINSQVCELISLNLDAKNNDDELRRLIEIIEQLLIKHENISIKNFHTHYIIENKDLLNKLITRWLLSKKIKLLESVSSIITVNMVESIDDNISWSTNFMEENYIILTKNAIAFFDIHENLILRFIACILNKIQNLELIEQVLDITFRHTIINYEPHHISFFFDPKNYINTEIQKKIQTLKNQHENFYNCLKKAENIKELACPLEHSRLLQAQKHYENKKINELADAQSVFADIFPKKIMLYGETHIHITISENNQTSLQEDELSSFSYTTTLPLQYFTEPLLLEFQRRIMMLEGSES